VENQGRTAFDLDLQVLAATGEPEDPPTLEPTTQRPGVQRLSERRRPDLDSLDPPPEKARLEAASEDLDLGQLGHGAAF